jgi:nucleoside-diphosphate-sugar epimerase
VRIVVTGASGNVGTALLRILGKDDDWDVTGVTRRTPDPAGPPYDHVRWTACDLGLPTATETLTDVLAGADAVVHLAWSINPSGTDAPMARTNAAGTRHVLRATELAGVPHLVCASSVAAYRPPPRWRQVDEGWPCDGVPGSAYSRGKADLERQLDRFTAANPGILVSRIRPCAIVQHDAGAQFARWLIGPLVPEHVIGHRWLPLPFWRGLRAQLVHSGDVADAIRLILRRGAAGPFNLAAADVLAADALADTIGGFRLPLSRAVVLGGAWATWRLGVQPAHPGWLRLADRAALVDTDRARTELGWRPRWSATSALTALLNGIRADAGTVSPPLAPRDLHGLADRVRAVHWGSPSHQAQ